MLPFKTLLLIDKKSPTAVYRQIANGLAWLIRKGLMQPGSFLPSSREMASLLGLHRRTVVAAYDELNSQDWIETIPRKGVRVSPLLPEIKPRTFKSSTKINGYAGEAAFGFHKMSPAASVPGPQGSYRLILDDGFPDVRIAPIDPLLKAYRKSFQMAELGRYVMYSDPAGSLNLRSALARFLADTRGLSVDSSNVLISSGAQMAIFMTARMILKKGSTVLVGEPNYHNANRIFQQMGATLLPIPVDEYGMDVDLIEKVCSRKRPSLLYIIPHHHHPTTVTLSAERRMKLLQLIAQYDFPVIEDDYDYDFHYGRSPILPLASADHGGKVIYIGSLSKSIATTIRVGYMVAPANFIRETAEFRKMINIRGDILLEEGLAELFHNGTMHRHLKKSAKLYHHRRDLFCEMLAQALGEKISFAPPSGGMATWVGFRPPFSLTEIAHRASAQGLFMSDGSFYNSGNKTYNALRMGFASLNELEMEEIISLLKKLVHKSGR
jgi:GntR family transcriptional regulator / MocR family aminotransferase